MITIEPAFGQRPALIDRNASAFNTQSTSSNTTVNIEFTGAAVFQTR